MNDAIGGMPLTEEEAKARENEFYRGFNMWIEQLSDEERAEIRDGVFRRLLNESE